MVTIAAESSFVNLVVRDTISSSHLVNTAYVETFVKKCFVFVVHFFS